jgi:hypothetical protein
MYGLKMTGYFTFFSFEKNRNCKNINLAFQKIIFFDLIGNYSLNCFMGEHTVRGIFQFFTLYNSLFTYIYRNNQILSHYDFITTTIGKSGKVQILSNFGVIIGYSSHRLNGFDPTITLETG